MEHEDGYCDECGAETDAAWLSLDGSERCEECARSRMELSVRTATRPEARDDGK